MQVYIDHAATAVRVLAEEPANQGANGSTRKDGIDMDNGVLVLVNDTRTTVNLFFLSSSSSSAGLPLS